MKSFCIKTNNLNIINSLLKDLQNLSLKDIYFINRKFKNFDNVIIHYKGDNLSEFLNVISDILTNCILYYYEPNLIKHNLNYNYFYFDNIEKTIIEENCYKYIDSDEENNYKYRKNEIWVSVLDYISNNKSMILDGFVNFRLENYNKTLEEIIDYNVKQYVIEKEYAEFISLLKMYINSKDSTTNLVHLIYTNGESLLLDENKSIINIEDSIFDSKYLSDISFSSNDYALNALLNLLPKRIEVHLIGIKDEFIDTLELIFTDRLFICNDCNLCKTYQILNNVNYIK